MPGGINPGDARVRLQVVGVEYMWMGSDCGMVLYRCQMMATLRTIPAQ